jgi:hypothetical protein
MQQGDMEGVRGLSNERVIIDYDVRGLRQLGARWERHVRYRNAHPTRETYGR